MRLDTAAFASNVNTAFSGRERQFREGKTGAQYTQLDEDRSNEMCPVSGGQDKMYRNELARTIYSSSKVLTIFA